MFKKFTIVIILGLFLILNISYGNKKSNKKDFQLSDEVSITMIWVEPGSFFMGSPQNEEGRNPEREKLHLVKITKGFWLAEKEITQEIWAKIMGNNPSKNIGEKLPVDQVSFHDVQEFIKKINEKNDNFRLPTEVEWEYACRAENDKPYFDDINEISWNINNSGRKSHPVGTKKPNVWGFYDMQGNILEWCSDWFRENYEIESIDPKGPDIGEYKVQRGGQFTGRVKHTRATDRQRSKPENRDFYVGFRLAHN